MFFVAARTFGSETLVTLLANTREQKFTMTKHEAAQLLLRLLGLVSHAMRFLVVADGKSSQSD